MPFCFDNCIIAILCYEKGQFQELFLGIVVPYFFTLMVHSFYVSLFMFGLLSAKKVKSSFKYLWSSCELSSY